MTSPPEDASARSRPDHGFTLLEVLVVIAVLGLSLGLVLNRGPMRSPALDARAVAGQLAGGLRAARAEAIGTGQPVLFALDPAAGYRVGSSSTRPLPPGLALSLSAPDAAGRPARGIEFLPDGSSSGGRIGVAGGRARLWVGVDWLTGRVSVSLGP